MQLTTIAVDSALGRWTHHEWRPPHLAQVVDVLWYFEGRTTLPRERTFPGGYLELIVHLGPRFREVSEAGLVSEPYPVACLTGMQTTPLVIEAPAAPCCVLGVRLHPVGAFALLARPLAETTGQSLDLLDVVGRASDELAERCHDAPTVEDRFRSAAAWISARIARGTSPHPGVAWAAARLARSHGGESVAALRERSGLGRTRFAEAFREQVGLPPKRFARVLRFRRALALLQRGERLSKLALAAGYYDQAHLNADFREFAGMTPTTFAASLRYANSPSLAEPA
jgi:AraC-like DNA-binding protein